jgi:hypothetical protein
MNVEHCVTYDELKILLLKCVGSKYPIKVRFGDDIEKTCFIMGFKDADCNKLIVSNAASKIDEIDIYNVKSVQSLKLLTFERLRGYVFNVN